jgi:hypothetical protein
VKAPFVSGHGPVISKVDRYLVEKVGESLNRKEKDLRPMNFYQFLNFV